MSGLSVSLFGRLNVHRDGESLARSMPKKAQELFAYLLLHERAHPREKLATVLWQHGTTERTKAYLRKALWQLRECLDVDDADLDTIILVDGDWIRIHPDAPLEVDVFHFEGAFEEVRNCEAAEMTADQTEVLKEATALYTGDLLENWYQEWCLKERERLKDVLLRMLDRLTRRCEQEGTYDSGIKYGLRALRIDPAHEGIHRHLMRLRFRAGDRTGALRQYERCAKILDQELGVSPRTATRRLHERMQEDRFPAPPPRESVGSLESFASGDGQAARGNGGEVVVASPVAPETEDVTLRDGLDRLQQLQSHLAALQKQLRRQMEIVEGLLNDKGKGPVGRSSSKN